MHETTRVYTNFYTYLYVLSLHANQLKGKLRQEILSELNDPRVPGISDLLSESCFMRNINKTKT